MAEFIESPLVDSLGRQHSFVYKKGGSKLYPADLAYDNKKTSFRIYFVYDISSDPKKDKECVFEMQNSEGETSVFELPAAEEDIQAIVRAMFMY